MNMPSALSDTAAADLSRAKRERILAVSRTVHSIPEEEGGMLKRRPVAAPPVPEPAATRFWRRTALAASGVAAGLVAGLLLGRKR